MIRVWSPVSMSNTRRTFLKGAGVTAGGLVVGTSQVSATPPVPDQISASGIGISAMSGVEVADWETREPTVGENPGVLDIGDYITRITDSSGPGQSQDWRRELNTFFSNYTNPEDTPVGRSMWQTVRAYATRGYLEDDPNVLTSTRDELALHVDRVLVNVTKRWNELMSSLDPILEGAYNSETDITGLNTSPNSQIPGFIDYTQFSTDTFDNNSDRRLEAASPHPELGGWGNSISIPLSSGNNETWETFWHSVPLGDLIDLPIPLSSSESLPSDLEVTLLPCVSSVNGFAVLTYYHPFAASTENAQGGVTGNGEQIWGKSYPDANTVQNLTWTDESREIVVWDFQSHLNLIRATESAYDSMSNKMSQYVSTVIDSLTQGALDVSQVNTPRQLIGSLEDDTTNVSVQGLLATELLASGMWMPEIGSQDVQVTVSHPDLATEIQGWLYIQWSDGADPSISVGDQISPSEYDLAYLSYEATDSEFELERLSGEETLNIVTISAESLSYVQYLEAVDDPTNISNIEEVVSNPVDLRRELQDAFVGSAGEGGFPVGGIALAVASVILGGIGAFQLFFNGDDNTQLYIE